jgi:hypothetical protein
MEETTAVEFESPHPAAASPFGLITHDEWLTEDGPHPAVELGAVAGTSEHRLLVGRATHVP